MSDTVRGGCWIRYADTYDPRKPGWRQRVAWWLRGLADRLSGEKSWTVLFVASPGLPQEDQDKCVALGLDHAYRLALEITRANLSDVAVRAALPDRPTNGEQK